jgi:Protein of unknown function (DUF3025)
LAHGLETIDWSAPWLAPYRNVGKDVSHGSIKVANANDAERRPVYELLASLGTAPVNFVPQSRLPEGMAYEKFIFDSKQCPTREGLHDFFNGLCWLQFPKIKSRLNQLQAEQIERLGSVTSRGSVRDALTVFDENAAFLFAPPALWQALLDKDWQRLFVTLRPLWAEATLVLFGHALLEKLVHPRKAITAHVYVCNYPDSAKPPSLEAIDAFIAADLSAEKLAAKPFAPLPIMGVPRWLAANENVGFYDDASVFRLPKV